MSGSDVETWLAETKTLGIRSILCLLDHEQLDFYRDLPGGLLQAYQRAGMAVGHVPVPDYQTPPIPADRLAQVARFYADLPKPMLVHCSAGIDRTGAAIEHILKTRSSAGDSGSPRR